MPYCQSSRASTPDGASLCDGRQVQIDEPGMNPFAVGVPCDDSDSSLYADPDAPPARDFFGAIGACFHKYADFRGRASRSEFWHWALFCVLTVATTGWLGYRYFSEAWTSLAIAVLVFLLFVPTLAVFTRRLRDANRITASIACFMLSGVPFITLLIANDTLRAHEEAAYDYFVYIQIAAISLWFVLLTFPLVFAAAPSSRIYRIPVVEQSDELKNEPGGEGDEL